MFTVLNSVSPMTSPFTTKIQLKHCEDNLKVSRKKITVQFSQLLKGRYMASFLVTASSHVALLSYIFYTFWVLAIGTFNLDIGVLFSIASSSNKIFQNLSRITDSAVPCLF